MSNTTFSLFLLSDTSEETVENEGIVEETSDEEDDLQGCSDEIFGLVKRMKQKERFKIVTNNNSNCFN